MSSPNTEEEIRKRALYDGPYATDEDWTLFLNQASYGNMDRVNLLKLLDDARAKYAILQQKYDTLLWISQYGSQD